MLIIAFDETTNFEAALDTQNGRIPVIGGVLYDGPDESEERIRVKNYYDEVINTAKETEENSDRLSEYRNPGALHFGKNTSAKTERNVKNIVNKTIGEFLAKGTYEGQIITAEKNEVRKGKYLVFCYVKSDKGIEKIGGIKVNDIVKDKNGTNLYLFMATGIVNRLSMHNPLINVDKVSYELPTRSFAAGNRKTEQMMRNLNNTPKMSQSGDTYIYEVGNKPTYNFAIATEMIKTDNTSLESKLSVSSIRYQGSYKNNQSFLYLSDSICSFLTSGSFESSKAFEKKLRTRMDALGVDTMIFAYDEIDVYYQQAWDAYERGNYFSSISICYDARYVNTDFSTYYNKKWFPFIKEKIISNPNLKYLKEAIEELNDSLLSNILNQEKTIYIYKALDEALKNIEKECDNRNIKALRYQLSNAGIAVYNHVGDYEQAKKCYNSCRNCADSVSVEEYTATMNRMSVLMLDALQPKTALDNAKAAVSLTNELLELKKKHNVYYKDDHDKSLILGKALSQMGQCYANMRNERAEEIFNEALDQLEKGSADYFITLSYLLHYYLDTNRKDEYDRFSKEYFGGETDPERRFEYIVKAGLTEDPIINYKYALYILVRQIYLFEHSKISEKLIKELIYIEDYTARNEKRILSYNNKLRYQKLEGHPLEIIYKYIALILHDNGYTEEAETIRKTFMACKDEGKIIRAVEIFGASEYYNETGDIVKRNKKSKEAAEYLKTNYKQFNNKEFSGNGDKRYKELCEIMTFMYH